VIAADTSSLVAYLSGATGADVTRIDEALVSGELRLPPVVVTELLSDATASSRILASILDSPMLDVLPDYWVRAGATRAAVLAKRLRARLPDALIAQSCIDHDVALITRDDDFRHFEKHCGLKLA
jgi:predicted nucleic acid-binding protein